MANRFASGKHSIAQCDRCGQRYKLTQLRKEVKKTKTYNLLVCNECWDPDQPQLQLGMFPVDDPQAVRDPRTDSNSYYQSGVGVDGVPSGGSRMIQWGWNPIGGASSFDAVLTPNNLVSVGVLGTVTVTTT
jgi:transcription elongation factor Elf1